LPFMSGRAVGAAATTGAATGAEGGAFAAGTGGSVRSLAGDQARAMPKWAEAKTCAFPRVIGVFCDFQAI
jgi:hypothetical protein